MPSLGENVSKLIVDLFDSDTAIHSKTVLDENVNIVNESVYDIPEYRIDYFYDTFPLLIFYMLSDYDNANYAFKFFNAVDRWPAHDRLSLDAYPDPTMWHSISFDGSDIVDYLSIRLTQTAGNVIPADCADVYEYCSANISKEHKQMIGSVVDRFALVFKMLSYEFTFHKYRNLINFIYTTQVEYEKLRYLMKIGRMKPAEFKDRTLYIDVSEDAIGSYLWYQDGDFYDKMFDTGYTAAEWKI